jgi:alkaline phosphatase
MPVLAWSRHTLSASMLGWAGLMLGCGFTAVPLTKVEGEAGSSPDGSSEESDTDPTDPSGTDPDIDPPTPSLPDFPPPADHVDNIIFMMGDGMGPGHVEAGRIFRNGPDTPLTMETLPYHAPIHTTSLYGAAIDSAAGATAMATGKLVPNSVISMEPEAGDIPTILEMAQAQGKSSGLVTTARTHDASPAAFAAHAPSRWAYQEIIEDMYMRSQPKVILGGGHPDWAEWSSITDAVLHGYAHVQTKDELAAHDPTSEDRLLGLFMGSAVETGDPTVDAMLGKLTPDTLTPERARDGSQSDPRLPEMVSKALEVLEQDPDGFFLFVENEHIDEISHSMAASQEAVDKLLPYVVEEVAALDESLEVVLDWISEQDDPGRTLLIMAADHDTCGLVVEEGDYSAGDVPQATCTASGHTKIQINLWAQGPGAYRTEDASRNTDIFDLMWLALFWG